MTFQLGEWRPVKELLKRRFPYLPPSTAAKLILLELAESKGLDEPLVTRGAFESPAVPPGHPKSPAVPYPDPACARESSSGSGTEEKKEKKRKALRLAPPEISKRIIGYLNEQANTTFKPEADGHRKCLQSLLDRGATEDEIREVIRKKSLEWKDNPKMSHCLRPSTLFGSKFDEYLGQAEARRRDSGRRTHIQRIAEAQEQGEWTWEGIDE